jgi:hypothetical protein
MPAAVKTTSAMATALNDNARLGNGERFAIPHSHLPVPNPRDRRNSLFAD